MPEAGHGRRAFLSAVAVTGAGITQLSTAQASEANACARQGQGDSGPKIEAPSSELVAGTDSSPASISVSVADMDVRLDASVIDSGVEGPTAFVAAGVHGDEEAGYLAADEILNWEPAAGRLVVLPRANPVAIEQNIRTTDFGNLNRNFLAEESPATPLAEGIWEIVERIEPDFVLSLHESAGIYGGEPSGVGQAVFHSNGTTERNAAQLGINRANRTIRKRRLMFERGSITSPSVSPSGLLTEKTAYSAGIPSFIVETYEEVSLNARIQWQKRIVKGILDSLDLYH